MGIVVGQTFSYKGKFKLRQKFIVDVLEIDTTSKFFQMAEHSPMLCECSFAPLGSCRSFIDLLFPFINQYLIHLCNSKSRRLFFVKYSFDFFFDYGRRNFLTLQFELIESFMYGYFDFCDAGVDIRSRYAIRIKIIPFDSLRF